MSHRQRGTATATVRKKARNLDYKPAQPPIHNPSDLVAYSGEHLVYEVRMFFGAIEACRATVGSTHFFRMASIEAFASHLRSLIAFFYPDRFRSRDSDVLAWHFLSPRASLEEWSEQWSNVRPALTPTLELAKIRADREVAHLTTERIAGKAPEKAWDVVRLGEEMRGVLRIFVSAAAPARLSEAVAAAIPTGNLGQALDYVPTTAPSRG